MTDKEKLEKIKRLADAMYNKMAYLTNDTRPIRQAMEDYHNFIVHEYNKDEQVDKPIDFEQELYNYFGQVKDFTLGMRIAKRFYDMGKNSQEPVSNELEEAMQHNAPDNIGIDDLLYWRNGFKAGAQWQKKKMMANTADAMIGLPYENKDGGYTHLIDVSRPLPVGNNKIAIIFKEE